MPIKAASQRLKVETDSARSSSPSNSKNRFMAQPPLLTPSLAREIERSHVEFAAGRLAGIERLPGNPFGVRIIRVGGIVALMAAALPVPWMNTIHLLSGDDIAGLTEIIPIYRQANIKLRAEIVPGDLTAPLAMALMGAGMAQQEFGAANYRLPAPDLQASPADSEVDEIRPEDFDTFLETFLTGFEFPQEMHPAAKRNMQHWIEQPNWRLYLARMSGQPAAAAVLSHFDGIAYLAAASTIPRFRNKGCQLALIARRIADADLLGSRLIAGQCGFGSSSHRNMQRAGMELAYTKAIWGEM